MQVNKLDTLPFKKRLCFTLMLIVDQFQIHVHKERIKQLRQFCPMTVQGTLNEVF